MAGKSEPLGVGYSLSIDDEEIGARSEFPDSLDHMWPFAKREQSRNVRKSGTADGEGMAKAGEGRDAEEHGHGDDLVAGKGGVYTGHGFRATRQGFQSNLAGKLFLDPAKFGQFAMFKGIMSVHFLKFNPKRARCKECVVLSGVGYLLITDPTRIYKSGIY